MLETGSTAPRMVLEDTTGQTVRISDYQGKHPVLLYFMRSASCPVCNRHVHDLVNSGDGLEAANVRVLLAVPDDREQAAAWKAKRQIPFPVLTARRGTPHEMIGLSRKIFGSMQQSGSLLIDTHGVIRHAHGATIPTNAYDRKGITAAIASLRAPA
ncbi:peroxiredoxin family protein [Streptomonospora sp. S1-112]|uniref:thioredoxin-dependent peroxiredoxin n=1 Tax=Streptomonospora mangrovi TaxID=2883123 RepID=A0A9X3NN71_9ACTN|nr:peroxiredoxin family protein [Streptomonospora mangrovi]MDA0565218.1 peroxiredoxin family protein [Streptomonospora mangrovi]